MYVFPGYIFLVHFEETLEGVTKGKLEADLFPSLLPYRDEVKSSNFIVFVLTLDLQLKISGAFHWDEKQIHRHIGIAPAGQKCLHP